MPIRLSELEETNAQQCCRTGEHQYLNISGNFTGRVQFHLHRKVGHSASQRCQSGSSCYDKKPARPFLPVQFVQEVLIRIHDFFIARRNGTASRSDCSSFKHERLWVVLYGLRALAAAPFRRFGFDLGEELALAADDDARALEAAGRGPLWPPAAVRSLAHGSRLFYRRSKAQTATINATHKKSEAPTTKSTILRGRHRSLLEPFSTSDPCRRCGSSSSTSLLAPLTSLLLKAKLGRSALANGGGQHFLGKS